MSYFVLVKICEPLDEVSAELDTTDADTVHYSLCERSFGRISRSFAVDGTKLDHVWRPRLVRIEVLENG